MSYSTSTSIVVHATREAVWDALTNPAIVKQYFFGTNLVTDWKVGSPMFFRGEWDGKAYEDRGTVLAFTPMQSLSFNYHSSFSGLEDTLERRAIISYDLTDAADGMVVTVRQSNVDTQERADHSNKNWQMVLEGLKRLVEV